MSVCKAAAGNMLHTWALILRHSKVIGSTLEDFTFCILPQGGEIMTSLANPPVRPQSVEVRKGVTVSRKLGRVFSSIGVWTATLKDR